MTRVDEPLYPPLALREAIVNALCHRDYSIVGGAVFIGVFDDRIEITSTGLLPLGLTAADLRVDHVSRPRNPTLAELFYRRKLIERWGRGTQNIIQYCRQAGNPEPVFEEHAGAVVVRFANSQFVAPPDLPDDLTDRQKAILSALADGQKRSASEIAAALTDPPSPATLRVDLNRLKKLGLVQLSGKKRGSQWSRS